VTSLGGKTAVVTGASRGIGAGIAESLGGHGVRVALVARNEAKLKERAARIKGSIPVTCDVSDPKSVEQATKRISGELNGAPDILVNNAGIFSVAVVEETTAETFVETINTNLIGPFLFVRAFLGDMKKGKAGTSLPLARYRTAPFLPVTPRTPRPNSVFGRFTRCCGRSFAAPASARR
jgi:3-oxoacyl-[acyl-carrier protein] reductase